MKSKDDLLLEIEKLGYQLLSAGYKDQEDAEAGVYQWKYLNLPMDNFKLKQTPFYYPGENDFIHFTSLENLHNILKSKTIRLYNLLSMDDKHELEYGVQQLKFPDPVKLREAKEDIYCLSMCSFSEIDETKEHLLWKLYGRDGNGATIRLNFKNNSEEWKQYHLSEVFYDLDRVAVIKELNELKSNIYLDPKVGTFFKRHIYDFENEVRLIFDNREVNVATTIKDNNNNKLYPRIYPDKFTKSEKILYTELPVTNFCHDTASFYNIPTSFAKHFKIPEIRISEIILGYRFSELECESMRVKVNFIDPTINVRLTRLKEYY